MFVYVFENCLSTEGFELIYRKKNLVPQNKKIKAKL